MIKLKKIIIFTLFLAIGFAVFNILTGKGHDFAYAGNLPPQYCDYKIIEEKWIDTNYIKPYDYKLDKDLPTKLVLINREDYAYMGISKIILLRDDGYFLELPGYGEGFEWWQVGDLNGNSFLDVAVMYENMGSGSFKPFYFYEWNGENFEILLNNQDLFNQNELVDLNRDGIVEVVHTFRVTKFAWPWQEIYKWQPDKNKGGYSFIKANHLFPEIYTAWLKDKELNPHGNFKRSPDYFGSPHDQERNTINGCLKEKAVLNSQNIFADIDDCYI